MALSDRRYNPRKSDVYRLHKKWLQKNIGPESGDGMFKELEKRIEEYNSENKERGGKAALQRFEAGMGKGKTSDTPLALAICTPIMARVYSMVQQSAETVFCDSTAGLDRYNNPLFLLSTSTPAGGVPLGCVVTSGESESTVTAALKKLKEVLPSNAFYGRGDLGAKVMLTDDSPPERNALNIIWPDATLLLCIFYFLQSRCTYLWDAKNKIDKNDRASIIGLMKEMVFAENTDNLQDTYDNFVASKIVSKYPHLLNYFEGFWSRNSEWALALRKHLMLRGNNTNNISEAGITILKEIIFQRVQAFNLVQIFDFITITLETYFEQRLLATAHLRLDSHLALQFKGMGISNLPPAFITPVDPKKGLYAVQSTSKKKMSYTVDISLGVCECPTGIQGKLCKHQAATIKKYQLHARKMVPLTSTTGRQYYAVLALGECNTQPISFYASLYQKVTEDEAGKNGIVCDEKGFCSETYQIDHDGSENSPSTDSTITPDDDLIDCTDIDSLENSMKDVFNDIILKLKSKDENFIQGVRKFVQRYNKLREGSETCTTIPRIASALHTFCHQTP